MRFPQVAIEPAFDKDAVEAEIHLIDSFLQRRARRSSRGCFQAVERGSARIAYRALSRTSVVVTTNNGQPIASRATASSPS